MPELPEVETVRRGLQPSLEGRRLVRVEQRRADLRFPFPERFVARLEGRTVTSLDRRSKYLLARLDSGETLIMHLGMTGRFTVSGRPPEHFPTKWLPGSSEKMRPDTRVERSSDFEGSETALGDFTHDAGKDGKHDHVVFETDRGATITYNDARRFGFMDLAAPGALDVHPLIRDIGIEPLGNALSPQFIAAAARGRKADLKAFLMDQTIICGLGNIYVCEVLFRARLSPFKPAGRLATAAGKPRAGADVLPSLIRTVLVEAIEAGGSTLRDYQKTDGSLGYFQHRFAVYGREGEACPTTGCTETIERRVQANRSTFHCPSCQKA